MLLSRVRASLAMIPNLADLDQLIILVCRKLGTVPAMDLLQPGEPLSLKVGDGFYRIVERVLLDLAGTPRQLILVVEGDQIAATLCLEVLLCSSKLRQLLLEQPQRVLVASLEGETATLILDEGERLVQRVCAGKHFR